MLTVNRYSITLRLVSVITCAGDGICNPSAIWCCQTGLVNFGIQILDFMATGDRFKLVDHMGNTVSNGD